MRRSILRSACALLVLALSACESASDPQGVEGTYSVRAVNGERPPVTVWSGAGGTVQVTDADVRLGEDGEAFVELTTRVGGTEQTATYQGRYSQSGDVLQLGIMESAQGQRVGAQGVVISGSEIAVTLKFAGSAYTGFYEYPVSMIARR